MSTMLAWRSLLVMVLVWACCACATHQESVHGQDVVARFTFPAGVTAEGILAMQGPTETCVAVEVWIPRATWRDRVQNRLLHQHLGALGFTETGGWYAAPNSEADDVVATFFRGQVVVAEFGFSEVVESRVASQLWLHGIPFWTDSGMASYVVVVPCELASEARTVLADDPDITILIDEECWSEADLEVSESRSGRQP
jgi:hypothetical protein